MDTRGAIAVAAGAAVWGLFWIPLRAIESAGLDGLAVAAIANGAAALVLFGFLWLHRARATKAPTRNPGQRDDKEPTQFIGKRIAGSSSRSLLYDLLKPPALLTGATLGASSVLYLLALLHTDVIRAVFLFYLLPIWAVLAARWLFAVPITNRQIGAIALTIIGVWLLLGGNADQLNVDPNVGDLFAIAAGMTWGLGLAVLDGQEEIAPSTGSLATFIGATTVSIVVMLLIHLTSTVVWPDIQLNTNGAHVPSALSLPQVPGFAMLLSVVFGLVLLLPSVTSQVWGADRLPASVAAMLTTTEILVASASAVWLVGTSVGAAGVFGAVLIALAIMQTLRPTKT